MVETTPLVPAADEPGVYAIFISFTVMAPNKKDGAKKAWEQVKSLPNVAIVGAQMVHPSTQDRKDKVTEEPIIKVARDIPKL